MTGRFESMRRVVCAVVVAASLAPCVSAQSVAPAAKQPNDAEYTRLIKEDLSDPRVTTELVDHLPASATVPTPESPRDCRRLPELRGWEYDKAEAVFS